MRTFTRHTNNSLGTASALEDKKPRLPRRLVLHFRPKPSASGVNILKQTHTPSESVVEPSPIAEASGIQPQAPDRLPPVPPVPDRNEPQEAGLAIAPVRIASPAQKSPGQIRHRRSIFALRKSQSSAAPADPTPPALNKPQEPDPNSPVAPNVAAPGDPARPAIANDPPKSPNLAAQLMAAVRAPARIQAPEPDVNFQDFVDFQPDVSQDAQTACTTAVLSMFPDICPNYLQTKCETLAFDYESVISSILDEVEDGKPYPKREAVKRKRSSDESQAFDPKQFDLNREDDDDDETEGRAVRRFANDDRRAEKKPGEYQKLARTLFQQAFVFIPHKNICEILQEHGNCLLPAILAVDSRLHDNDMKPLPFVFKKTKTKTLQQYQDEDIENTIREADSATKKEVLEEFRTARVILRLRKLKRDAQKRQELEDQLNFQISEAEGTVQECECCFVDCAMNRMIHCDGATFHWFCKECCKQMTSNQIGLSKYSLNCMSMDGCQAGFSHDQRSLFLDNKIKVALDRIEQEHILRISGIENLETCPFCPFAAEYPPVEENKEFQCQNPICEVVSCRLCRKATHIPKTCEEAARESGPAARLAIEEAMSLAMIRSCNKCGTPFIKELGCNKMTCTRPGCSNVQCYVCHKSCDYSHFDDTTRGGKKGNCPLFESAEKRHEDEVKEAEERAREEIARKNPDLDANLLKISVSKNVLEDDKRRKNAERR